MTDSVTRIPCIHLHWFQGIALIFKRATGVHYSNQAAGHACYHPETEGILAPLDSRLAYLMPPLSGVFRGSWESIAEIKQREQPDLNIQINDILARAELPFIRVDDRHSHESWEAWIHVHVDLPPLSDKVIGGGPRAIDINQHLARQKISALGLFENFGPTEAVLTWRNSD